MSFNRILCATLFLGVGFLVQSAIAQEKGAVSLTIGQDTHMTRHAQAIATARAGDHLQALAELKKLRDESPETSLYLFDYIVVATWAGQYKEALAAAEQLSLENTPDYVLLALASALRHSNQGEEALELYTALQNKRPEDIEPKIGQVATLLEIKRAVEALLLAQELFARFPEHLEIQNLLLAGYLATERWIEALDKAQMMMQKNPHHAFARQTQFLALWRLGAPHIAERVAPESLSEEERANLIQDQKAFEVRWGRIAASNEKNPYRWQMLDRLISQMPELADAFEARGQKAVAHRIRADRLAALRYRQRFTEVAMQYPELATNENMPSYVRQLYAESLTNIEQPEAATKIFAEELPLVDLDTKRVYLRALMESNEYSEGIKYIDSLHEDEWVYENVPALRMPNENYPQLLIAQSFARSTIDDLKEGQSRLEALKLRAPASTDINEALATTYHYRGWHQRAEELHSWLLGADPQYYWSSLGRYENRRSLMDYQAAHEDLRKVQAAIPEETATLKATREWEVHMKPELRIESTFGRSGNQSPAMLGSRDRNIDAWLYSSPLAYDWRVFSHTHQSTAVFEEDTPSRLAQGVGIEYRRRHWYASAETYALRSQGMGLSASGAWRPDDNWSLDAAYTYKALDAPLRAYTEDITSNGFDFSTSYRWHESRQASIGVQTRDFSDGNNRQAMNVVWTERVINMPAYKLDIQTAFYTSKNSLDAAKASYFNPSRDRSLNLTLLHEWTQFNRSSSSLRHRVEMGLGNYWQEGYGNGGIGLLRYEIVYVPNDQTEFRLGIGRTRRPYDGQKDNLDTLTFSVNWRI